MANEQTIADLAYHLWMARGCPDGSSEIDWLAAERQIAGSMRADGSGVPKLVPDGPGPVTNR